MIGLMNELKKCFEGSGGGVMEMWFGICLEEFRRTKKNFSHNSQCPG
jgi:hypothetical protein